ncbi:MAG TPA: efflux RND transporter permease subunit, partial [Planctomycetota bacterium]|nr:efflux RND transporter permease subunit [Planctomycetota bacterium]
MLRTVVQACLHYRGTVVALACLLMAYGVMAARSARLDVLPEFAPPQVTIQTEAPGLAPEQVESLVTSPIEEALGGLGQLSALRSESIQGLSVVTAVFDAGTDVYRDRQLLAER